MWSKCSRSCGRGFRQRRVSCQRLKASGSVQVLADTACEGMSRPEHREPCVSEACVEWISGPWGQVHLISLTHFKALIYVLKEEIVPLEFYNSNYINRFYLEYFVNRKRSDLKKSLISEEQKNALWSVFI